MNVLLNEITQLRRAARVEGVPAWCDICAREVWAEPGPTNHFVVEHGDSGEPSDD